MKTVSKIGGSLLICLALLLLVVRVVGFEPRLQKSGETAFPRFGFWLKGDLVTTPVADWSFTDKYPIIQIQTRTWYLVPHSVTIACNTYNGQLYVGSVIKNPPPHPHRYFWHDNVARDPHVRLKIGNQLYDRTLSPVTDPAEIAAVLQARAKKYPPALPANAAVWVYHVLPG